MAHRDRFRLWWLAGAAAAGCALPEFDTALGERTEAGAAGASMDQAGAAGWGGASAGSSSGGSAGSSVSGQGGGNGATGGSAAGSGGATGGSGGATGGTGGETGGNGGETGGSGGATGGTGGSGGATGGSGGLAAGAAGAAGTAGGAAGDSAGAAGSAGLSGLPQSGAGGAAGAAGAAATGGAGGAAGALGSCPTEIPSCTGTLDCDGESCCTSLPVRGGTFPMGRGTDVCNDCENGCASTMVCSGRDWELPEHPVTVHSFCLDKFEVTVGRFARFLTAYDEQGWRPLPGSGANAAVEAAQELSDGATGWQQDWDDRLPSDGYQTGPDDGSIEDQLHCSQDYNSTWAYTDGDNAAFPVNCINWYTALAFCIWDGGRLPTEAEWEYAAAGGDQNLLLPWGEPTSGTLPANYSGTSGTQFREVGSAQQGNGRWGQADLTGSLMEWVFDYYDSSYYTSVQDGCTDCANLVESGQRVVKSSHYNSADSQLRAAARGNLAPVDPTQVGYGFRCARAIE